MADVFSETTSTSWFGRIGSSIKGILFGALFFIGSIILLFWNEGRAVTTANSLEEGASAVVSVSGGEVLPANDQKLIHLSGEVTTEETLRDPILGMEAQALRLAREVQMYQWQEEKKTSTRHKTGGGSETTTTYEYAKGWSDQLVRSSDFKHAEGHTNPQAMPVPATSFTTSKARLGGFQIPARLIGLMHGDEPLQPTEAMLANIAPDWKGKLKIVDENLYLGKDPASPQIGDARVTLKVLKPDMFSILSRQSGTTLEPYATKAGRDIERVESGAVSAQQMFANALRENTILTWIARAAGFIFMFLGISMVLKPLAVIADVLPFAGRLADVGIGLVAGVIAFAGSLIIIAIAWLAVRPLLGGTLLVLAIAAIVWGIKRARQRGGTPPPMTQVVQ
jgi:hypothetical protein